MKTRISVLLLVTGISLFFIAALPTLLLANQLPDSSASRLSPQATITPTPVADLSITDPPQLITQLPIEPYQPFTMTVIVRNTGATTIDNPFYIDVFLDPQEPPIGHIPITQSNGYAVVSPSAWSYWNETALVTITAQIGFAYTPTAHLIYVMADSLNMIGELDEGNNISPPLIVTSTLPYLQATPSCTAGPDTTINIVGGRWPTDEDVRLFWQGGLETITAAPHSGSFSYSLVKTGLSADVYTIMAASDSYTMTTDFTVPCPPSGVPVQAVIIGGEESGLTRYDYLFRLNSAPVNATLPITYRWEATGQATITQTEGLMETAVYNWPDAGIKTITVTADNGVNIVSDTHQIDILRQDLLTIAPPQLITPLPIELHQRITFTVIITNNGDVDINKSFRVGVALDPQEVLTDHIRFISRSEPVYHLAAGESRVITIISYDGFTSNRSSHLVYGMVDAYNRINETDETNNISPPLSVAITPPSLQVTPSCAAAHNTQMTVTGYGWSRYEDIDLFWDGALQTSIPAYHSGHFSELWTIDKLHPGVYTVMAVSDGYTTTAKFTAPCGTPVQSVRIGGARSGVVQQNYTFMAESSPISTTLPITYRWAATGQTGITETGGVTETAVFNWSDAGTKTITVTADNGLGIVTNTHQIDILGAADLLISDPPQLITPLPIELYQPISFTVAITNIGDSDINNLFFIDIFIDPQNVFTDHIPVSQSSGYSAISSLAAGDGRVITITSHLGFTTTPTTHLIYAMADSLMAISEEDETNNISPPLTIESPPPSLHISPSCTTGSEAIININGSGWPKDEDVHLFWQGIYETAIFAPHSGSFSYIWTKTALSPDTYELRAISDSYTKVAYFTVPCAIEVMLTGAETAVSNQIITITATVSPTTTVQPITYTWQINDNTPIVQNGGLTNTLTFTTPSTDTLRVTVTASSQHGDSMPTTHHIAILSRRIYLPAIWANN